jgi:hypothetical protein
VAFALGAIFGVTGTFGATWIKEVSDKVSIVETKFSNVDKIVDAKYAEAERKLETWAVAKRKQLDEDLRKSQPGLSSLKEKIDGIDSHVKSMTTALSDMRKPSAAIDGNISTKYGGMAAVLESSNCAPMPRRRLHLFLWFRLLHFFTYFLKFLVPVSPA